MMCRRTAVAVTLFLLAACCSAVADGMLLPRARGRDSRTYAGDISEPQQKALIIHRDGIEQLVLQISYSGSASDFAWVVPTPSQPKVFPVYAPVFHRLRALTDAAPHYWFNADWVPWPFDGFNGARQPAGAPSGLDVEVLKEDVVGVYDVSVLRAGDAQHLFAWLRNRKYRIPEGLVPLAADYIRRGWVFTAVRVSADRQKASEYQLTRGTLQSLSFVFRAAEPVYPLKISSLNSGKTEVLLYVLAPQWVNDPAMDTLCRGEFGTWDQRVLARGRSRLEGWLASAASEPFPDRLTKLRAEFTPGQMTHDIVFSSDDRLGPMPAESKPAPLLANIGVLSALAVAYPLSYPYNALVVAVVSLGALSRSGRRQMRRWISFAISYCVLTSLASAILFPAAISPDGPGALDTYTALGTFSLKAAGVLTAVLLCMSLANWLVRSEPKTGAQ